MRKVLAIGILAAALAVTACTQAKSENGGPSISRNYPVGGFTVIEVAGPFDVDVHTGGQPAVSATGPQKMIEHMMVEVKGDRLMIYPKQEQGMFHMGWNFG